MDIYARARRFFGALLAVTVLLAASCVPAVGPTVTVPEIPYYETAATRPAMAQSCQVDLRDVIDSRPVSSESSGVVIRTEPEVDITLAVRAALVRALRAQNIVQNPGSAVVLSVEVKRWDATLTKSTPAEIDAQASLVLKVKDPRDVEIYSGTFKGNTLTTLPIAVATDVQEALGKTMGQAISELSADAEMQRRSCAY